MEITYKKGNRVTIKDGSSTKMATVVADGLDSQKRVRVRVDGFPMDMSITTNQSSNVYVVEKMAKGSTVKGDKWSHIKTNGEYRLVKGEKQVRIGYLKNVSFNDITKLVAELNGNTSEYFAVNFYLTNLGMSNDKNSFGSVFLGYETENDEDNRFNVFNIEESIAEYIGSMKKFVKEWHIEENEEYAKGSSIKGGGVKYAVVDENSDRIYVRSTDKDFIDKKHKELKEIYPNDKLSVVKFAKGSTIGEKEYLVKAIITDENEMEIPISVNVFAKNKNSAMDKADDNIREQNPQWEDFPIDIESVDELKKYAKGSTVGGKKYQYYILQTKDGKVNWVVPKKIATIEEIVENAKKYNINIFASNFGTWESKRENGNRYTTEIVNEDGSDFKTDKEYNEISRAIGVVKKVKYGNGGGVAISSESGLAVGTNADLLMNQNNLQYRKGGGVGMYSIRVWESEDDRDMGESFIIEKVSDKGEAKEKAKKMYQKNDLAAVEVEDENGDTLLHLSSDGIEEYADGGNMSMGFNYEIGGL